MKPKQIQLIAAIVIALSGFVLFNFFGNATRGYINTNSLFFWWFSQWEHPNNQHGWVILGLSIWLVWFNLKKCPTESSVPKVFQGSLIIFLSLFLHLLGYFVQQTRISILGFLVFIIGFAFLIGGRKWGRSSIFPSLMMLFSMPLNFLSDSLGFHLRHYVIIVSHKLSHLVGIDVIQSGTQLFSPNGAYSYDVAPACSGINSLIALLALSLIIGYIQFKGWGRKLSIFILSVPYAFIGNTIRIFSIIVAAELFGEKWGMIVHEWFGFLIFIIVLGLALLTASMIKKFFPETDTNENVEQTATAPLVTYPSNKSILASSIIIFISCLSIGLFTRKLDSMTYRYLCGIKLAENQIDPVPLPSMLDINWAGRDVEVSKVEKDYLPADTGFSRKNYVHLLNPNNQVFLSIVLSGKDRSSIHKPEICLVAQGWTVNGNFIHEFNIPNLHEGKLRATVLRTERRYNTNDGKNVTVPSLYTYWFVAGDDIVATHWQRMFKMAKDRLFGFKNHRWAYIIAQTTVLDSEEAGLARINEVMAHAIPEFQDFGVKQEPVKTAATAQ